jgi:hypothetical protein
MHPDDLKAIWVCYECKKAFAFHSDINDHKDLTGHKLIERVMTIHHQRHWHNNNDVICLTSIEEAAATSFLICLIRKKNIVIGQNRL